MGLAVAAERARDEGRLVFQDLLRGPVRLEDVFSFVINGGGSGVGQS